MENILLWSGIALIVIGWSALGWQASRRLALKDELEKFQQKKRTMQLHRNYCRLIILAGIVILLIVMIV